jgi:hypothetical protein
MMTGGAISWKSRRQDCVSLSTSEAEYVAASQCGQEALYLREILRDFGFAQAAPTEVYEDNLACVAMSEICLVTVTASFAGFARFARFASVKPYVTLSQTYTRRKEFRREVGRTQHCAPKVSKECSRRTHT